MFVAIEAKEAKKKFLMRNTFLTKKLQTVFSVLLECFVTVFNQLSVLRCLTVYVVFKQAIQAIEGSFEKILVKKLVFVKKIFFDISS